MKKGQGKISRFDKILEDIKSVKIQGAENIAKAGIRAILLKPNKKSAKKIIKTRPTEPLMQNGIRHVLKSSDPKAASKKFLEDLKVAHKKTVERGSSLIRSNMNIYTHCHSSTVVDILKYAKRKRKKKFIVYTSEVEPLLQGHMTARDLAKAKIKVVITPDLAAEEALRKCDLFFFGVDAFTKKSVINKIGTNTLCKLAKEHGIPRYACGVSKKFTKNVKMEMRPSSEIIHFRDENIRVINPAFDETPHKNITGIISEFGILTPKSFTRLSKKSLK